MQESVDIMLREYAAIREEVVATLAHRHQVLAYGSAGIGVLLAGIVTGISQGDVWVSPLLLAVVVPLLSLSVLHTWITEVVRARRASWYLRGLERRVNQEVGQCFLRWEDDLRRSNVGPMRLFHAHYRLTEAFFLLTGVVSALLGAEKVGRVLAWMTPWGLAFAWCAIVSVMYVIWYKHNVPDYTQWDKESTDWPDRIEP